MGNMTFRKSNSATWLKNSDIKARFLALMSAKIQFILYV